MTSRSLFKWRHFLPDIIVLSVRWYCRYPLSYRDLEEIMSERGVEVDHSTIHRWVLSYAPELDKRIRPTGHVLDLWIEFRCLSQIHTVELRSAEGL